MIFMHLWTDYLAEHALEIIGLYGYAGLFFIMMLDNIGVPIPSEIVLPMVGYVSLHGVLNPYIAILVGTAGSLAGGFLVYYVGKTRGRKIISKLLLSEEHVTNAENWFKKYGHSAIFFARLIPFLGKTISLPAGVSRMDQRKYLGYSSLGYLVWNTVLIYSGYSIPSS